MKKKEEVSMSLEQVFTSGVQNVQLLDSKGW